MIKTLLKRGIRAFANRYAYDATYMSQVVETSTSAGVRLSVLPLFSQYRGPKNAQQVWAGALLGSTLDGDCGPCVQLIVDMAREIHVPADQLTLCLQGLPEKAGDVGLGFQFSKAAIADGPDLDALRAEIDQRYGPVAVTAASFAASSGRIYPVLKRGLGFGQTCIKVTVAGEPVRIAQHA